MSGRGVGTRAGDQDHHEGVGRWRTRRDRGRSSSSSRSATAEAGTSRGPTHPAYQAPRCTAWARTASGSGVRAGGKTAASSTSPRRRTGVVDDMAPTYRAGTAPPSVSEVRGPAGGGALGRANRPRSPVRLRVMVLIVRAGNDAADRHRGIRCSERHAIRRPQRGGQSQWRTTRRWAASPRSGTPSTAGRPGAGRSVSCTTRSSWARRASARTPRCSTTATSRRRWPSTASGPSVTSPPRPTTRCCRATSSRTTCSRPRSSRTPTSSPGGGSSSATATCACPTP